MDSNSLDSDVHVEKEFEKVLTLTLSDEPTLTRTYSSSEIGG